jgi:sulfite reductase (ferredoxin)
MNRPNQTGTAPVAPPAAIPEEIEAEIRNFESEMDRLARGELSAERFRAYRLSFGIYGQRQPGVQMVRVKIPGGILDARRMETIGRLAVEFGHGIAHVTTRQDVQFHHVQLERVPNLMRELAAVGMTTREACGNSVRNITACPVSGRIADEWFSVTPYASATMRYLLRHPFCQLLPRKFKLAFSGCPEDCVATAIHDIGLRGRVRERLGRLEAGFEVAVGGGLGTVPFLAQTLDPFVPVESLLEIVHAVLAVFSDEGNRRNRLKARMKFVVDRLGIEVFREQVTLARAGLTPAERDEAELSRWMTPEEWGSAERHLRGELRRPRPARIPVPEKNGDPAYALWLSRNVRAHLDPARALVTVPFPLGDIAGARLCELGELVRGHGHDEARTTIDQNVILPEVEWVDLPRLYAELSARDLAGADTGTARDVVSCPGADTCGLAVTASKRLAVAIREELDRLDPAHTSSALDGVTIRISGCPNACGQHHVGQIGLHGVAKKVGTRLVPHYQLHLGGRIGYGQSALGEALHKIPARHVPAAVRALLEAFAAEAPATMAFPDWARGLASGRLDGILAPHLTLTSEEVEGDGGRDWGQSEPFHTDDIQTRHNLSDPGEDRFLHAEAELGISEAFLARGQTGDALAQLYRGVLSIARVLLEPFRKRPDSDRETVGELRARVIDRGRMSDAWNDTYARVRSLRERKSPDPADVRAAQAEARAVLAEGRDAYPQLLAIAGDTAAGEMPG